MLGKKAIDHFIYYNIRHFLEIFKRLGCIYASTLILISIRHKHTVVLYDVNAQ